MTERPLQTKLYLVGEVVETCQRDGKRVAKIALKSCCIELEPTSRLEMHLGDHVVLDAGISFSQITPFFDPTGHPEPLSRPDKA
jgi:hypothetical protein